jgi:hypothetical protein
MNNRKPLRPHAGNTHQPSFRGGVPQRIQTVTGWRRLRDKLSQSFYDWLFPVTYVVAIVIVLLDVFVWRK